MTFDEDGLPIATNQRGWIIEELTGDGWVRITLPLKEKRDAKNIRDRQASEYPDREFRVYPHLLTEEQLKKLQELQNL